MGLAMLTKVVGNLFHCSSYCHMKWVVFADSAESESPVRSTSWGTLQKHTVRGSVAVRGLTEVHNDWGGPPAP